MRSTLAMLPVCLLACAHTPTSPSEPEPAVLPDTLTGTLVATDDSERVLVVTNGLIAAMSGELASQPEYDALRDVECSGPFECRFAANGCEGTIRRNDDTNLMVALTATSGPAERCEAYNGEFEISDQLIPEGTPGRPTPIPVTEDDDGADPPSPAPLPELPRGQVVIGKASTGGAVDVEAARSVVQREARSLQACYDTYLTQVAQHGGVMEIEVTHTAFDLHPRPRPALISSSFEDTSMQICVLRQFHDMELPRPTDGKSARVHYVVSFVEH